jgi:tetratricopeptide (TPR) repeat protein
MPDLQDAVWRSTTALLAELPADVEADTYRVGLLHWFTPDLLAAVRPAGDPHVMTHRDRERGARSAAEVYQQLADQPFVEAYPAHGLTLHDLTREAITTHLWEADPTFVREVSARAAACFEDKLQSVDGAEPDELVELAYHRLVADEDDGIDFVGWLWQVTQTSLSRRVLEGVVQNIHAHVEAGRLSPEVGAQSRLWRLWAAYAAQRYEQARDVAREIENADDTPPDVREEARYFLAESLRTMGDLDAAVETFRALERDPESGAESRALAMVALGDIDIDRGQLDEAERLYAGALRVMLTDAFDDLDDAPDLDELAALAPARWQGARELLDLLGLEQDMVFAPDDEDIDLDALWAIEVDRLPQSALADPDGDEDEGGWQFITVGRSMGTLWHQVGILRYRQSRFDESAVALELAMRIFEALGEVEEAAQSLNRLRVLAPRREGATSAEAVELQLSMLGRAEEAGDRVAQVGVLLELASTYEAMSDNERATKSYEHAVAVAADDENVVGEASAHESWADLLIRIGRRSEAEAHLDQAEQLYRRAGMRQGIADVLLSKGDLEMARNHPELAATAYRTARDTYSAAGILYGVVGSLRGLSAVHLYNLDLEAAAAALEEAAEVTKRTTAQNRVDILGDLADVRERLGDVRRARELRSEATELARAWDLRASEGNLLVARGHSEIEDRQLEGANDSFSRATELFEELGDVDGEVRARLGLSRVAEMRDDWPAAVDLAQQAVDLAPPDEPITATALSQLGLNLGEVGRFEDAESVLREAMRIDPDSSDAVGNLGYVLLRAGKPGESIGYSKRALELDNTQNWVLLNIGHALLAGRHSDEAEAIYRQAIAERKADDNFREDIKDIERLLAADPELPRAKEFLSLLRDAQAELDRNRSRAD